MPDHTEYETGARKLQAMPETRRPTDSDTSPEIDAEAQSEKHHQGGSNDGVSSANPRVMSGNDDGDSTFPVEKPTRDQSELNNSSREEEGHRPGESFPPFDDPAFSSKPATPAVAESNVHLGSIPEDSIYAGHPEFSQDAGKNKLPRGMGNSRPVDDFNEKTRHSDGQDSTRIKP